MQPDKAMSKTLPEWLAYCEQLHPKNIDMGLDRVRQVARRMGLRFDCPVFTVAGTNGKGSTCSMLGSILGQAGYRVGVYTSPHLVHFEERLRLLGEMVDTQALCDAFARVEAERTAASEPVSLTYFEFSTLAIMDVMHKGFGAAKYAPCPLLREMVEAGRLGVKSGAGFYEYPKK